MHVDEVQPRRRAPVAEQPRLDVRQRQRLLRAADCRRGRSARRTGSSPPANRRRSCAAGPRRRVASGSCVSCHLRYVQALSVRGLDVKAEAPAPTERAIISSSSVGMTRTTTRLAVEEITAASPGVSRRDQLDAQEAESLADARPNRARCVLTDAAGEDERVESAERGGKGADPLSCLVAEERNGFGRADVVGLRARASPAYRRWSPTRRAVPTGNSPSDETLRASSPRVRARKPTSPGSRSPVRVLISRPAAGVKPMLVSMLLPSCTAARLAPLPRCARITRPCGRRPAPRRGRVPPSETRRTDHGTRSAGPPSA